MNETWKNRKGKGREKSLNVRRKWGFRDHNLGLNGELGRFISIKNESNPFHLMKVKNPYLGE